MVTSDCVIRDGLSEETRMTRGANLKSWERTFQAEETANEKSWRKMVGRMRQMRSEEQAGALLARLMSPYFILNDLKLVTVIMIFLLLKEKN